MRHHSSGTRNVFDCSSQLFDRLLKKTVERYSLIPPILVSHPLLTNLSHRSRKFISRVQTYYYYNFWRTKRSISQQPPYIIAMTGRFTQQPPADTKHWVRKMQGVVRHIVGKDISAAAAEPPPLTQIGAIGWMPDAKVFERATNVVLNVRGITPFACFHISKRKVCLQ